MKVIVLGNCDLSDESFTIDLRGEEITWNITRIQAAAAAGEFGPPVLIRIDTLAPPDWSKGYLDRDKVDAIKRVRSSIDQPALLIQNPPHMPHRYACFCDGQHRITARQELGLPDCSAFVVPWDRERQFRITQLEVDVPDDVPPDGLAAYLARL